MVDVRVRTGAVLGDVPTAVYGHFTEHLAHIMYDGLWSELLMGRKFESPIVGRKPAMAQPWEAFAGVRDGHTHYRRGPDDMARFASPQGLAHHAQGVEVDAEATPGERGLAQSAIPLSQGVTYGFRGSVRRVGPAGTLTIALRASDGQTILASQDVEVAEVTTTRFGPDFPHNTLWMDDSSWLEIDASLTPAADDPEGVFTMTFQAMGDVKCLWMFNWVSLMPADNAGGWHAGVVKGLRELPAQSLKWPGGCMADDYDWRYGIGDRDARYCTVDQAWITHDENDAGIDEFMHLCALTGALPVLGVNGGTGTPEMAAQWVEYCNGDATTEWGAKRAANGHPEPYDVRTWVIGNEQWGFFETGYVGPELYAERYLRIAEAMRKVDADLTLVAVGLVGEFNRVVLAKAAHAIDQLQIHLYTPDSGPPVEDAKSATHKIATAQIFDRLLGKVREDIASVPGAEHVKVCLDEWGWGHSGHAGAIFMAACINAMHRAAPLVRIGSKAAVVNVDAVINRVGEQVERTGAYDVFRSFNEGHLPQAATVEITGDGIESVDVSALVDPETGACTVHLVNRAPTDNSVNLTVDGHEVDAPSITTRVVAQDPALPAGPSVTSTELGPLGQVAVLPPHSLTTIRIGAHA